MKTLNVPLGANATRVSATDRDTLVSTTGSSWYSPGGQPVARPKSDTERALERGIQIRDSKPGRAAPPSVGRSKNVAPMNRAAARAARVMERYRIKAAAESELNRRLDHMLRDNFPVPMLENITFDDGIFREDDWKSTPFADREPRTARRDRWGLDYSLGTNLSRPPRSPAVKSREERLAGQRMREQRLREQHLREAINRGEQNLCVVEIDHTLLDIITCDPTRKERAK